MSLDPLKCTFLRYYISALRGCCALKLLHALQIEEGLLAHTPRGTGVPLKIFNRKNLKSGLKFRVWANKTSGLVKVYSWHFFQSTFRRSWVITRAQFPEGPAPKICESEKKCPTFGAVFDNFRLWSPISSEQIEISTVWKNHYQLQPLPRWA